jgi:hypothetical protein
MKRRGEPPELAAFKDRWCRWVDLLERVARHRRNLGVDLRQYDGLYHDLIRDCRALANAGGEVDGCFYRSLEKLVLPWLTLRTLARSDPEILLDLLTRCREAERSLGVRTWARVIATRAPWVLAISLLVSAGMVSVIGMGRWQAALDRLRDWTDILWFAALRSSDFQRFCLSGLVIVLASILIVSRTARR